MMSLLSNFTQYIYHLPLSTIIILIMISVLVWGVIAVFLPRKLFLFFDVLLMAGGLFGVYLLTFGTRAVGEYEVSLIPFHSFHLAKTQIEMYRSMLMNIFLFVPFGMAFPFLLPGKKGGVQCLFTGLAAFLLSCMVEFIQYSLKLGRCETDDVIMAVIGGILGSLSYVIYIQNKKKAAYSSDH